MNWWLKVSIFTALFVSALKVGPWVISGEARTYFQSAKEEQELKPLLVAFSPENVSKTCAAFKGEQIYTHCFKKAFRERTHGDTVMGLLTEGAVASRLMQFLDEEDLKQGRDNHLLYSYDFLDHMFDVLLRLRNLEDLSPTEQAYRDVAAEKMETLFMEILEKTRALVSRLPASEDQHRWTEALKQLENDFNHARVASR